MIFWSWEGLSFSSGLTMADDDDDDDKQLYQTAPVNKLNAFETACLRKIIDIKLFVK